MKKVYQPLSTIQTTFAWYEPEDLYVKNVPGVGVFVKNLCGREWQIANDSEIATRALLFPKYVTEREYNSVNIKVAPIMSPIVNNSDIVHENRLLELILGAQTETNTEKIIKQDIEEMKAEGKIIDIPAN